MVEPHIKAICSAINPIQCTEYIYIPLIHAHCG